jgi:hypothetical protein
MNRTVFTPSSRNNPCPICNITDSRCRQSKDDTDYWQCMTYADARKGETVYGYKCLGHTRDRLWGQFRLDNFQEWSEQQREEWRRERERRQQEHALIEAEKKAQHLSAVERDREYRKLLSELTLHLDDRKDLIRRGFTNEQITLSGFKSVEQWQKLQSEYSHLLPGISLSGRSLISTGAGYLCPVRSVDGLIVALQIRLRALSDNDKSRYRWLTSRTKNRPNGQTPHLYPEGSQSGELPLSIHIPQQLTKLQIGICEGVGAKPFLASQRLGIPVIGAAGGQHASSSETFKHSIQQLQKALWEIVQETGLSSIVAHLHNPQIQKELLFSVNKEQDNLQSQKYQDTSLTLGIKQKGFSIEQQSSSSTSDYFQQLKKRLLESLQKTLNSIDLSCSQSTTQEYKPVELQSSNQIEIVIIPDAGSIINENVMGRLNSITSLLRKCNLKTKFAWWGQKTKSDKDIDELDDLTIIDFITPEKFSEIAKPQVEKSNTPQSRIKENTSKIDVKQLIELPKGEDWEFWQQVRKFTTDIVFEKKYFDYEVPELGSFLAIKSGLGTGKTYYLIHKLLKFYSHLGAISIGHRNSLLIQFCELAGDWCHLQNDLKGQKEEALLRDIFSKIACCVDSLVHFEPEDFDNKLIIIDETESVIAHLLLSDTSVGIYREKAKQRFAEALDRAALVICLDGHLTDATIKYLQSLMKNPKKLVKVQNTYQGNRGKVNFYRGAKAGDKFKTRHYNDFVNKAINNQNKFVFAADSKEKLESLERMLRDRGRITFRFDSTTPCEEKKRFLQNPVAYLTENKIEILLYSPSGDAGLNIDIQKYFTDLYFLFMGVLTTSAQLQMLGRIRDPEAVIHIYCTPEGLPGNVIGKEVIPEKIQNFQTEYVFECAKATLSGASLDDIALELAQKLIAASSDVSFQQECLLKGLEQHERKNLRQCLRLALEESGYSVEEKWTTANSDCEELKIKRQEIINEYSEKMFTLPTLSPEEVEKKSRDSNITSDEKLAITKTRLLSRLPNIETAVYREPITINQIDSATTTQNDIEAEASAPNEQNNQLESQAVTLPDVALNQDNSSNVNSETFSTDGYIEKTIFSAEFIKKVKFDNPQYISQLELYWLVTHPEIAKRLQQGKWHKKLTIFTDPNQPEYAKKLDISGWKSQWLKIHKLLEMGFGYFLAPGAEWSNDSPEAKAFYNSAKNPKIERLTGIRVGESTPCELIGRVVKSLGHKTESQQVGKGKDKVRVYRISQACLDDPIRQAILKSIEKRYTDLLAEKEILSWDSLAQAAKNLEKSASQSAETLILQGLDVEHLPSRCSIKNQNKGVSGKPEEKPEESITAVDELVELLKICDNAEDVTEIFKYYEAPNPDGSQRNLEQKEDLVEAALLFSPLEVRSQLQRWWNSVLWTVRDFWRQLESTPG